MQTYTFDQLDERARSFVVSRYGEDQAVQEEINEHLELDMLDTDEQELENLNIIFASLDWRFSEHGERIA